MCRTSILTSLYDGTPFSSKGTNKNDGTWQRPSVPSRFLEIPLPCTRFRSFRLRRESDLDYGKHVCVVVEADKEIILLAFVGDYARAALLLVLCKKKKKKNRHKAFVVLVISLSSTFDRFFLFRTINLVRFLGGTTRVTSTNAQRNAILFGRNVVHLRTFSARSLAKEKRKKKN